MYISRRSRLAIQTPTSLPLSSQNILDKPLDWTGLWEKWASQGSAVLFESAGALSDASQWVIVAGGAREEAVAKKGRCYLGLGDQKKLYEPGFWAFLDERWEK